jgi:hypothetical protein
LVDYRSRRPCISTRAITAVDALHLNKGPLPGWNLRSNVLLVSLLVSQATGRYGLNNVLLGAMFVVEIHWP